ncbi:MAG: dephospho-CoA kinase [Lachnospiraceae bacterium]|jgi:dephospho-CoA kinase|nr:dephospho-CoA kinase [Lachnospiraceae bacterium]
MKIIGITGGIGGGKSSILNFISSHYISEIYYADEIARELELPGTIVYDRLVSIFGEDILENDPDRAIDKKKFAQVLYSDKANLDRANMIIHPAVENYINEKMRAAVKMRETELFFVEAALLIENGYNDIVDEMWYIYADDETRIRRLMEDRGYSREKAISIMESQLSDKDFRDNSDVIIDNNGDLKTACDQVKARLEGFTWVD